MTLTGLGTFMQTHVLGLLLLVIAAAIMTKAFRGDHRSAMTSVVIVLLGLAVAGLAISGKTGALSTTLSNMVFG